MKSSSQAPIATCPRGVVGGSEISQASAGAHDIYMGLFRVPPGARSRPHYHEGCESAVYMLCGSSRSARASTSSSGRRRAGDMLYVPPRETHVLENLSDDQPAEYVVARDAPTEDSVEVPWAEG